MKRFIWAIAVVFIMGITAMTTSCRSGNNEVTPRTDTVVIDNMEFRPAQLSVRPGDTVVWINRGIVEHDVTVDSLETWTSGKIDIGESWKMVPEKDVQYFCSIHPTMKGAISVEK